MEVFSGRGCTVEDEAKDENWFFYTRDGFHYEVQVDVDRNRPDRKLLIIICPYMGKVEERHGHLLERAVNMMKEDLKNEDIDNYQLNYNPDDCSLDACIGIYYENCSKQDLDRKLASTFELDDRVNDVMAKISGHGSVQKRPRKHKLSRKARKWGLTRRGLTCTLCNSGLYLSC